MLTRSLASIGDIDVKSKSSTRTFTGWGVQPCAQRRIGPVCHTARRHSRLSQPICTFLLPRSRQNFIPGLIPNECQMSGLHPAVRRQVKQDYICGEVGSLRYRHVAGSIVRNNVHLAHSLNNKAQLEHTIRQKDVSVTTPQIESFVQSKDSNTTEIRRHTELSTS